MIVMMSTWMVVVVSYGERVCVREGVVRWCVELRGGEGDGRG
jgi:hypothetical protein